MWLKTIIDWLAETHSYGGLDITNITSFLVVAIVLATVAALVFFGCQLCTIRDVLGNAIKRLSQVTPPLASGEYPSIDKYFRDETHLASLWIEFDETLTYDPKDKDAAVLNSRQAEDFINPKTVFATVNMDLCSAIPGLLTAMGLFGTFLSIFAALSILKLDNGQISEIQPFINNLAGKFVSSIFGIGAAFIFLLAEKYVVGEINKRCHELQTLLNGMLTQASSDTALPAISSTVAKIETQLKNLPAQLSAELESKVGNTLEKLLGENSTILANSTKIMENCEQLLEAVQANLRLSEDSVKRRDESIKALVNSVVQSFRQALFDSANDDIEKLTEGLRSAATSVEQMNLALAKSLVQYERAIESQRLQIDEFLTEHQGRSHDFTQQQQKQWQDFSRFYQDQVSALAQSQAEQLETQMKAVQNSCEELLRSFERSSSVFQQKVNSNIETLVTRIESSSELQLKELKTSVDYILTGVDAWTESAQSSLSKVLGSAEHSANSIEKVARALDTGLTALNLTVSELKNIELAMCDKDKNISEVSEAISKLANSMDAALLGTRQAINEFARQADAQSTLFQAQERLWLQQKPLYQELEERLIESLQKHNQKAEDTDGYRDEVGANV